MGLLGVFVYAIIFTGFFFGYKSVRGVRDELYKSFGDRSKVTKVSQDFKSPKNK